MSTSPIRLANLSHFSFLVSGDWRSARNYFRTIALQYFISDSTYPVYNFRDLFFAVVNCDLVQSFVFSAWTLYMGGNTTSNFPTYKHCARKGNSFNVNCTDNAAGLSRVTRMLNISKLCGTVNSVFSTMLIGA
jgi:hypothetical protein